MAGTIRIGVVGGNFGRRHVLGFQQVADVEVVGLCQRNREAACSTARMLGVPRVFGRLTDMLAEVDAVSLAVPNDLHFPMTLEALKAGKHVLCEKPMALNVGEAGGMLDAACKARRCHMLAFNWRFVPAFQYMKALMEEGYLGKIYHLHVSWLVNSRGRDHVPFFWRHSRARAGVGTLGDVGVHLIDMIHVLAGRIGTLCAHSQISVPFRSEAGGEKRRRVDVEDCCAWVGELEQGGQIVFEASSVSRYGRFIRIEAYGSAGTLIYAFDRGSKGGIAGRLWGTRHESGEIPELDIPSSFLPPSIDGPLEDLVGKVLFSRLGERFAQGIREGTAYGPNFEDGLRAQRVLAAIVRSADGGGGVRPDYD